MSRRPGDPLAEAVPLPGHIMLPRLLIALPDGRVVEHPVLLAPVRSGDDRGVPDASETAIPLPPGASLVSLPGQRPVGIDPETGDEVVLYDVKWEGKRYKPDAVAAVLPPGYTRRYLPVGHRLLASPQLTQWAYTAAGWDPAHGFVTHAVRTDPRDHWDPRTHSTADLPARIEALRQRGGLWNQIALCAGEYRCFTAQNTFYGRDEGAIPASSGCNARCVGCISELPPDEGVSSHTRMDAPALDADMADIAVYHLQNAEESMPGRAMVSFGQGCEGEPLTRAASIARAIRRTRAVTPRGSININTNGSRPQALQTLIDAGLDACRVSLNSARPSLYEAYYRPVGYDWNDVRESLRVAREGGLYIALNLLTFPGVTDRAGEIDALCDLVAEFRVHQVQTRNLALDPETYMRVAREHGHPSEPLGLETLITRLQDARPGLVIGNYARGLQERGDWTPRPIVVSTLPVDGSMDV